MEPAGEIMYLTPPEITDKAKVTLDLLPEKSKAKYNLQYKLFMEWCASKQIKNYSESVILTYLSELSKKYKSPTLWSINSMLKSTLLVKDNVNIGKYPKVIAFLKKQSVGHIPTKSRIFEQEEIEKFLCLAPDEIYLLMKVVLIIGISGACRTDELTNMTIDDVVDKTNILLIHVPDIKTYKRRTFTVCNIEKENFIDVVAICKNYFNLRPTKINSRRLFVKYQGGKCAAQHVGHHTIGAMPFKIATYLKLSNPKEYTGHAFRRTSAMLLANSGANFLALKRHGGWEYTSVAEGYVEDSLNSKNFFNTDGMAGSSTMTDEMTPLMENIVDTGTTASTTFFFEKKNIKNLDQNIIGREDTNIIATNDIKEEENEMCFENIDQGDFKVDINDIVNESNVQQTENYQIELEKFKKNLDKFYNFAESHPSKHMVKKLVDFNQNLQKIDNEESFYNTYFFCCGRYQETFEEI